MTTVRKPVRLRPLASAVRISPLLAAVPLALPGAASAATIYVTDPSPNPGFCSIVDAVASINNGALAPGANCTTNGDPFGVNDTINLQYLNGAPTISFVNAPGGSALTLLVPATISGSLLPNGVPAVTIERSAYANGAFRLIDTSRDLFLDNLTLAGGKAVGPGGAVSNVLMPNGSPQVTLTNVVLSNNSAGTYGGAIASRGAVIVTNSGLVGNQAMGEGGAIFAGANSNVFIDHSIVHSNGADAGGGISAGSITLIHSEISGNSADHGGGGLFCTNLYADYSRILNNTAVDGGGGVASSGLPGVGSLTVVRSTVSNNSAHDGGGIIGSSVTLDSSTISGNSAGNEGGGVFSTYLQAANSTISGNNAVTFGGGVFVNKDSPLNSRVNFSTVTGNSVSGTTRGAGIFVLSAVGHPNSITLLSSSTLFFGNSGGTDIGFGSTSTLLVDGVHLLVGSADAGTQLPGSTLNCDPQLGPLGSNGGPTRTHALPNGSCAIDTGDFSVLPFDQRGYTRNFGNGADIGAFELQPVDQMFKDGFEL